MIIKSIVLTNFQCYFGENIFEFKSGLNVVIGDNGAGKSKLYDAFYWVLYDKTFDSSSRTMCLTRDVKAKLVSDKAKLLCLLDGKIETSVEIIFSNNEKGDEYIIKRIYQIYRTDTGNDTEFKWRESSESQLFLYKKEKYLEARLIKNADEIASIIKRILPNDIQPYLWFQGEQVDGLIDFKNNSTLTNAINVLSDIREFDFFVDLSKRALESAENEFRKEQRRLIGNNQKSESLDNEKKKLIVKIERLEKELSEHRDGLMYAQEEQEKLHGQVEIAQHIRELDQEEKQVDAELQKLENDLKNKIQRVQKNLFTKFWALKGMESLVDIYAKKFSSYENKKMEQKIEQEKSLEIQRGVIKKLQSRLPINVPEPIYIQKMLEEEKCLVCNREAPVDSDPWLRIKELLEREDFEIQHSSSKSVIHNNFQDQYKKLYQEGLGLQMRMPRMNNEIHELLEDINVLSQKKKRVTENLERIRSDIQELINSSSINSPHSTNILNAFTKHQENIRKYDRLIQSCDHEMEVAQSRIEEIEGDFRKLVVGQLPQTLIDKVATISDFRTVAVSTRERVFNRLILKLEEEANKHYNTMSAENKSIRGRIRLVKQLNGNYMPKIQDSVGQELHSINDANIILIKLSVIMAIISAKKSSRAAELYPLISDAPTSKFTENYTVGFCRTVGDVYSQSIIMSKDFYMNEPLLNRLLNEVENLGNVYIIEPSVPEDKRMDRNDLEIKIIRKH